MIEQPVKMARLEVVHEGRRYGLNEIVTLETYSDPTIRAAVERNLLDRFAAAFHAATGFHPAFAPRLEWHDETIRFDEAPVQMPVAEKRPAPQRGKQTRKVAHTPVKTAMEDR